MRACIDITGLKVFARIGVLEQERLIGNRYELLMKLYYDATAAMESDDITAAVNYADITDLAVRSLRQPAQLLEYAVGRLRRELLERFPAITSGSITLVKLHPPIPAPTPTVAFTLEW